MNADLPRIVDPGSCRCCGLMKKCRLLNRDYDYKGQNEIYFEMVLEAFGITLSNMKADVSERLICATCVVRLRDAFMLKKLIERKEAQYLKDNKHVICVDFLETKPFMIKQDPDHHEDASPTKDQDEDQDEDQDQDDMEVEYLEIDEEDETEKSVVLELSPLRQSEVKVKKEPKQFPDDPLSGKPKKVLSKTEMKIMLAAKMEKLKAISRQSRAVQALKRTGGLARAARAAPPEDKQPPRFRKSVTKRISQPEYSNLINIVQHSHVCPFKNHTGNLYCHYCRAMFTDPKDLREHTSTHDPKEFPINLVDKKNVSKLDITRLDCRICDATHDTLQSLKDHLKTHSIAIHDVPDAFVTFRLTHPKIDCVECGETFLFIDKLIDHMAVHFGRHVCEICGAKFIQARSLESHVRSHARKGKTVSPCAVCGKVLSSIHSKRIHVATMHDKKPVRDCHKCEEKFMTYQRRNRHMAEVHGAKLSIKCPECDKDFPSRQGFIDHNNAVHVKKYNYECSACFKKFFLAGQLRKHRKSCNSAMEAETAGKQ